MEYKLKDTTYKDAFNYGYLLKRLYPYIKPELGRALIKNTDRIAVINEVGLAGLGTYD